MNKHYASRLFLLPDRAKLDNSGWTARHLSAVTQPAPGFESAYVGMLRGWLLYADIHRERYDSGIGADYVLGPQWARIGAGLRDLLNGELGRMDAGTLDALIANTLTAEDFDPDDL